MDNIEIGTWIFPRNEEVIKSIIDEVSKGIAEFLTIHSDQRGNILFCLSAPEPNVVSWRYFRNNSTFAKAQWIVLSSYYNVKVHKKTGDWIKNTSTLYRSESTYKLLKERISSKERWASGVKAEHTIPFCQASKLFLCKKEKGLSGAGLVTEAILVFFSPLCLLTEQEDQRVNAKAKNHNENLTNPFQRYKGSVEKVFSSTSDTLIEMESYTIDDHFKLIKRIELLNQIWTSVFNSVRQEG